MKARIVKKRLELFRDGEWVQTCCPFDHEIVHCGTHCALFDDATKDVVILHCGSEGCIFQLVEE